MCSRLFISAENIFTSIYVKVCAGINSRLFTSQFTYRTTVNHGQWEKDDEVASFGLNPDGSIKFERYSWKLDTEIQCTNSNRRLNWNSDSFAQPSHFRWTSVEPRNIWWNSFVLLHVHFRSEQQQGVFIRWNYIKRQICPISFYRIYMETSKKPNKNSDTAPKRYIPLKMSSVIYCWTNMFFTSVHC